MSLFRSHWAAVTTQVSSVWNDCDMVSQDTGAVRAIDVLFHLIVCGHSTAWESL